MKANFSKRSLITAIAMVGAVGIQAPSFATTTSTFNISTNVQPEHSGRRVATNGAGLFLHVYIENSTLYGQYLQNGVFLNSRFVVAESVDSYNIISVAMNSGGSAVVTWWNGTTAVAQLIPPNASGLTLSPITIGSGDGYISDTDGKGSLQVAMDDNGDFVVVRSSGSSAFANTFDQSGNVISGDVIVSNNCTSIVPYTEYSTDYESYQCGASVGINNGQFVVAFSQNASSNRSRIYAQRYTLAGTPQGNQISVDSTPTNTYSSTKQTLYSAVDPQVAMDSSGNFVVAWVQVKDSVKIKTVKHCYTYYGEKTCYTDTEYSGKTLGGIFAQRFNASDTPTSKDSLGNPKDFKVASDSTVNWVPDISMNDQGSFVIAWESDALKTQKQCYTDGYGHKYCYDVMLQVGSAKVTKFTADDLKIKSNSKKTLETGKLKKLPDGSFEWNPSAETPAVAIDDTGAYEVQWDSNHAIAKENLENPEILHTDTVKGRFSSK